VVTYTVIVKAPNPDQKLMPGMTASITIITEQADNVVTVPGKALRFKPDMDVLQAYYKTLPENERPKETPEMDSRPKQSGQNGFNRNTGDTSGTPALSEIWVKQGKLIHPVKVTIGINDGNTAEVKSGLKEGDEVVTAIDAPSAASKGSEGKEARSPFMPQRPQQRKK
jgi:HlyD family secretion protein